jgi:hypothetical protein
LKTILILMALVAISALAQNRWDKMTAEEKQARALNYIVGAIIVIAVAVIVAVMI